MIRENITAVLRAERNIPEEMPREVAWGESRSNKILNIVLGWDGGGAY